MATKGLTDAFFGCVASKGLSGAIFVCMAGKGVTGFWIAVEGVAGCREAYRRRRPEHECIISKIQRIVKKYDCRNGSGSNGILTSRKNKKIATSSSLAPSRSSLERSARGFQQLLDLLD